MFNVGMLGSSASSSRTITLRDYVTLNTGDLHPI